MDLTFKEHCGLNMIVAQKQVERIKRYWHIASALFIFISSKLKLLREEGNALHHNTSRDLIPCGLSVRSFILCLLNRFAEKFRSNCVTCSEIAEVLCSHDVLE